MCATSAEPGVQEMPDATAEGDEWAEPEIPQDTIPRTAAEQVASGSTLDPDRMAGTATLFAGSAASAALATTTARGQTRKARQAGFSTPSPSNPGKQPRGGGAPRR